MFTFTIGNVKQLSFQSTLESAEKLVDRHLYDSEFQIEGVLTVNAFADNAKRKRKKKKKKKKKTLLD